MFVAGIDAHATYSVTAIVSNTCQLVDGPVRIKNMEADLTAPTLWPQSDLTSNQAQRED